MSDHATDAYRRVSLKERYPNIDDPLLAIDFALLVESDECHDFLTAWQTGSWDYLEDCYPKYLERIKAIQSYHEVEGK
jgi:hypothetical protein